MSEVRTRFAPSPTGFMHVGGIRTALFCWLYSKANDGKFVLRIEDTDKKREVEGSVEHIVEALNWLGLDFDEGPDKEEPYGPYFQSKRLESYKKYAQVLIDKGLAYIDPYTEEQINEFREDARSKKVPFLYRNYRPEEIEKVQEGWYGKGTLRFKVENPKRYTWNDVVRGELSAGEEALDDIVLIKADGYPTYNFSHIIDDYEMKISHIIRGEEFISSTPKYLSLYEALEIKPPVIATVPPILNKDGGKKLSKRDGARDVLEYRDRGYLPISIINFLVGLGWNDGTEDDVYDLETLIDRFDLTRIQKSGAKFDETKLDWIEWQQRKLQINRDTDEFFDSIDISSNKRNDDFAVLAVSKARNVEEFKDQYNIYLEKQTFEITEDNLKVVDKSLTIETAREYLQDIFDKLSSTENFSAENIEKELRGLMVELDASPRAFLNLCRWAITNRKVSPNLFEMISLLGKVETLERLRDSIASSNP